MGFPESRSDQPLNAANKQIPSVLFLHHNAAGPQAMIEALGHERAFAETLDRLAQQEK